MIDLEYRRACEEESGPVAVDDTDEQMHARIIRWLQDRIADEIRRAARGGK